jgi:NADH-quinone oxidoreductase subunit N
MLPGFSSADFYWLLPELVLSAGALVVLAADLVTPRDRQDRLMWIALAAVAATAAALLPAATGEGRTIARGLLAVDLFGLFFKVLFLLAAAVTVLMSARYLEVEGVRAGEYYFLVLCATVGMMVMAAAVDLITIFIGLETMAVSFYVLAGFIKPSRRSNEAAIKYFLLGAFSLGILLYGMSLLYGLSGGTSLKTIVTALAPQGPNRVALLAIVLIVAGVGFKIAAVPFHMWAPDVYEGAPTPITAFLSVGSKAASFAMLFRIFLEGLPALKVEWQPLFYVLAVLTMTVGNVAAITQSNIKRMLAYSSIAHAGYVLVGVVAATPRGVTAALIYLMVYAFMQLGAFAVVTLLRREDVLGDELKDLGGLFQRQPAIATAMLVFMLSLGGIPPTAGFMGKLWLFGAAIEAHYVWLAVIGVVNSAISLYYYVRVVVFMWIREETAASPIVARPAIAAALAVAVAGTLALGVYPRPLFDFAELSSRTLGMVRLASALEP